jgi:RNase P subunit RPR2
MDLEDTVAAQRDYIKELEAELERYRVRLHEQNEYSLRLQTQLERQQQHVFHECKWCGTTNRCDR